MLVALLPVLGPILNQVAKSVFPNAEDDDLTDSAVQALIRFRQGGFLRLQTDEKDEMPSFHRKASFY